jgi:hypothetical protein
MDEQYVAGLERRLATLEGNAARLASATRVQFARASRTAVQSIPDSTATAITFTSDAVIDPSGMWDATNPTRLTFRKQGLAVIFAHLAYAGSAAGERHSYVRIGPAGLIRDRVHIGALASGTEQRMPANAVAYPVDAGQYVELIAQQTTGAPLNVNVQDHSPILTVILLG